MTSLDRKTRAINAQDIASQLKLKDKKSLKSLKSKNSELLSKYRKKLNGKHSGVNSDSNFESSEVEEVSDRKLIPKVTDSFQGVVFDNSDKELEIKNSRKSKPWKRRKQRESKGNKSSPQKNSRFKKFKPFKRSKGNKKSNKSLEDS